MQDNFGVEGKLGARAERWLHQSPQGSEGPELSSLTQTVGIQREELGRKAGKFGKKSRCGEAIANRQ